MSRMDQANQYLFEELVERIQVQSEAAGIAVAIVDAEGKTLYQKFFGYRDKERQLSIDENTIFGLASVTKSFVALSVMQLSERKKLNLDDPVSRYIPEFTNRNQELVTIRHFLSHSAGFYPVHRTTINEIAGQLGLMEEKDGDLGLSEKLVREGTRTVAAQLDAQTKEHGLIASPGSYMSYCNDGFGLLSEIVRRVSGETSFAEYVRKNILEPLGMSRSGCEYRKPFLDENAAALYKKKDGRCQGGWNYYDNAFVLPGAGAMKSTISDLKRYLAMYLQYGKTREGNRLLSMEGIRTMVCPRIEYRPDSFYCYGLATKMLDDLIIVEHGGSLTGVSSNISWSYGAGAGVIVLCNTSDVPVSVIADAAMKLYHGRTPLESRELYQEHIWDERDQRAACGFYRSGEGAELEIRTDKDNTGRILLLINGQEVRFVMVQRDLGIVRRPNKDVSVKLFRNETGEVFAAGYGGRMLPRVSG